MKKIYQAPEMRCYQTDIREMLVPMSLPSNPPGPSVGARQRQMEMMMENLDEEEENLW